MGRANLSPEELDAEPLGSIASPPVAELIDETNVPSNNFFAEMLLKRLGADAQASAGPAIAARPRSSGSPPRLGAKINASDGSGLSRRNSASPADVGELLVEVARDGEDAAAFRESLPVAGREGTLADRMDGTAAEGNCAAKTGTLDNVSALSGYCNTAGTRSPSRS